MIILFLITILSWIIVRLSYRLSYETSKTKSWSKNRKQKSYPTASSKGWRYSEISHSVGFNKRNRWSSTSHLSLTKIGSWFWISSISMTPNAQEKEMRYTPSAKGLEQKIRNYRKNYKGWLKNISWRNGILRMRLKNSSRRSMINPSPGHPSKEKYKS